MAGDNNKSKNFKTKRRHLWLIVNRENFQLKSPRASIVNFGIMFQSYLLQFNLFDHFQFSSFCFRWYSKYTTAKNGLTIEPQMSKSNL